MRVMPWRVVVGVLFVMSGPLHASEVDDRIKLSAESSYVFQVYLDGDEIKVESKDGVVVLTGTVLDDFHKSLAQQTVASIPGVKDVDNRLALKKGSLAEKSDEWITAKVRTALLFRRNVDASEIRVSVKEGIVTLRGDALSEAQRGVATQYAGVVEGVRGVRNEMTVSATPRNMSRAALRQDLDDASITAQVRMVLLLHRSTSVLNTQVSTDDGVVTVRGKARNMAERDLVGELVHDIKGVNGVDNQMSVGE